MSAAKSISPETRDAILTAAWQLIAAQGRTDVSQSDIAKSAGVSRQTVFYAFGNRAGLLTAMAAHHDDHSPLLARLNDISRNAPPTVEGLTDFLSAWLDYLPEVFPVASLLDAAALTDPDAKAAIENRMVGRLLAGLTARMTAMAKAGTLVQGRDPARTAEAIWELIHVPAWRLLVVDRGWTAEEFRQSRLALAIHLVTSAP